jgi:hypothetical protein
MARELFPSILYHFQMESRPTVLVITKHGHTVVPFLRQSALVAEFHTDSISFYSVKESPRRCEICP